MLTKVYDVLLEQLKRNLEIQDYYKNICTEVIIKNKTLFRLFHPSYVKNDLTKEDVFPNRLQNDIDKEFDAFIALVLVYSMKEDKQELEIFRTRTDFNEFKEIKDFGTRKYVMDFGKDIEKAVVKCIDIAKYVYDAENVKSIKILTTNTNNGEIICKKTIIAPPKVDGVATRVVEQPLLQEQVENTETTMEYEDEDNSKFTGFLIICGVLFLVFISYIFNRPNPNKSTSDSSTNVVYEYEQPTNSGLQETNINISEEPKEKPKEDSQFEIIGNWIETDNGGDSSQRYGWRLVKNKKNGTYKVVFTVQGEFYQELNCKIKKIKRDNEYLLYDIRDGKIVRLDVGEKIFIIPNFDNDASAILIRRGQAAYVFSNDISAQRYDYYATLQSIY